MSGELSGKTAIVTGAGHGIGLAIAKKLAGEGATVVCADIDEAAAHTAGQHVSGDGGRCDVTGANHLAPCVTATTKLASEPFSASAVTVTGSRHGRKWRCLFLKDVLLRCAHGAGCGLVESSPRSSWHRPWR